MNDLNATVTTDEVRNGVNVTLLKDTVEQVSNDPSLGEFQFRAKNSWIDGGLNKISINDYYGAHTDFTRNKMFEMHADEPPVLLGKDRGANPVEYILAALSGCMTTTLVYHSAAQGVSVDAIQSEFEGDIDLKGFLEIDPVCRKGYNEIRINFKVRSDASKEQIEELVKKSPVYDVVTNPTKVVINIEKE